MICLKVGVYVLMEKFIVVSIGEVEFLVNIVVEINRIL